MKCSACDAPLDPAHTYIVAAFWPMPYVLNLHPHCLREIIGKRPFADLGRALLTGGWSRLALPGLKLDKP